MAINRREFLVTSSGVIGLSMVPKVLQARAKTLFHQNDKLNPIDYISASQYNSLDFNGDNIDLPHDILWNTIGFINKNGGIPSVSEHFDTIVVGGGIAGLYATYKLKHENVLLLEQDKKMGGNSKGENYLGSEYSIGAAYICNPEEGDEIHTLLSELDLLNTLRAESADETSVFFKGNVQKGFWAGVTDENAKEQFIKIQEELSRIYNDEFPEIPLRAEEGMDISKVLELDQMTFEEWLDQFVINNLGTKAHPHIKEYFQLYAWSSFGGSIDEISAAQMINFVSCETDQILAFPGGNAKIAEKLYQQIKKQQGLQNIRANSFVLNIEIKNDNVEVCYFTPEGSLRTVSAKKCIFAAPKFVAERVMPQLSEEQKQAMSQISYRAYVVANIILNKKIKSPSFELYCLEGEVPESPRAMNTGDRQFTDICFGSWAQDDEVNYSVLTIYKSLPFDGARQFLFSPFAHDKHKEKIIEAIKPQLKALSLSERDILGVRMTRWGHSLPLAQVGLLANEVVQKASQNVGGKIFFVNQDNYANPCFEAAISSVEEALVGCYLKWM